MGPKNETWFNNCPGESNFPSSIGGLFSIVLVQVFVCVHVFTESMTNGLYCGFTSLHEMEKAKGTLVECLLLGGQ